MIRAHEFIVEGFDISDADEIEAEKVAARALAAIDDEKKARRVRYKKFYAGIANDVDVRLKEHNAVEEELFREETGSEDIAAWAEGLLHDHGLAGGEKVRYRRKPKATAVYVYRITMTTIQDTNA